MKILIIEDHKNFCEDLISTFSGIPNRPNISTARSRNSAISAIDNEFFDLIILDQAIPTSDDGLDISATHGQNVYYHAQQVTPGTPIYFLTNSDPDAFLRELVGKGKSVDLWGSRKDIPLIEYYAKQDVDKLVARVFDASKEVHTTNNIAINTRGKNINLQQEHRRLLKVFTRRSGGVSCDIFSLGGLSEATTLKVVVKDSNANIRSVCVAKLGHLKDVQSESTAYDQNVKHLRLGVFAPVVDFIPLGPNGYSAIFYSLAEEHSSTFFSLAQNNPAAAALTVPHVRQALSRWSAAKTTKSVTIREIRQTLLPDGKLADLIALYDLADFISIEDAAVITGESCIHGDLHGGNILVDQSNSPVIIDYGDVGPGYSCIDPITLELSLLFHPDSNELGLSSEFMSAVETWPEIDSFLRESRLRPLISACREWAYDEGVSDIAVLAAAYAFAIRQLKYDTVSANITVKLLESITNKIKSLIS